MVISNSRATLAASLLLSFAVLTPAQAWAQGAGVDPEARRLLQRMTTYVASLGKFGLDTANTLEVVLDSGQKIQFTSSARSSIQRPDRLRSERIGDVVSQYFYYDGRGLTLFNPDDGYYATVPAPGTIDATVDFARDSLDIVAPAGDLITLDAYERQMSGTVSGFVVGKSVVGGVRCDHLAFRGADFDWQIWIEDGDRPLPRKYVITSLDLPAAPQFEVLMSNWNTAPDFGPKHFEFSAPAGATRIEFLPVGDAGDQP